MPDLPLDHTETRENFRHFTAIQVRWNDLDACRHLNNARYHAFFDSVIMHFLIHVGGFDLLDGPSVPFTVENLCRFHRSLSFPDRVDAGLRVARLGTSSVRYEPGLFRAGESRVCATGYFVDVFVDRTSGRPVPLPADIRAHLASALV